MCLKKEIDYHQNHKICRVNLLCNNILYFALFAIDFFCRFGYNSLRQFAGVMELADVLDSKSTSPFHTTMAETLDLSRFLTTQYVNGF